MPSRSALVLVDVQYDFLPPLPDNLLGGSLSVATAEEILPHIRHLLDGTYDWEAVAVSQDYHPEGHVSFADTHGLPVLTKKTMANPYSFGLDGEDRPETITQTLWPQHCVIGSRGAEVESSVRNSLQKWEDEGKTIVIQKGSDTNFEAYSAFLSDPRKPPYQAELTIRLRQRGVGTLFIVGIATDFCVRATAIDAKRAGFEVFVIQEGIRAVGGAEASTEVFDEWSARGIEVIKMDDVRLASLGSQ